MAFLDTRHYCDETGLYPALERQAQRLGFSDLLSIGDEPQRVLDRFPPALAPVSLDGMAPETLVRRMRNAR
jgi:hypothetical protein